jgi:DNA-binding HxlR family transcriptional regulator
MVKRTSHKAASCPVARPLDAIGDWWTLLIVRDAFDGLSRFSEFHASLGLAKNILSSRLRTLVEHGILEVVPASDGSAYHEYVLTKKGVGLFPIVVALRQWGETFCFAPHEQHVRLVDRQYRRPVRRLELISADGRSLTASDTIVLTPSGEPVSVQTPSRSAAKRRNRQSSS